MTMPPPASVKLKQYDHLQAIVDAQMAEHNADVGNIGSDEPRQRCDSDQNHESPAPYVTHVRVIRGESREFHVGRQRNEAKYPPPPETGTRFHVCFCCALSILDEQHRDHLAWEAGHVGESWAGNPIEDDARELNPTRLLATTRVDDVDGLRVEVTEVVDVPWGTRARQLREHRDGEMSDLLAGLLAEEEPDEPEEPLEELTTTIADVGDKIIGQYLYAIEQLTGRWVATWISELPADERFVRADRLLREAEYRTGRHVRIPA